MRSYSKLPLERQYMLTEDYEFYSLIDVSDVRMDLHYHDYYELLYLRNGNISAQIGDTLFPVYPGDVLLYNPNQMHKHSYSERTLPYERYLLWIMPSYVDHLSTPGTPLSVCFYASPYGIYHFPSEVVRRLERLLSQLEDIRASDVFGKDVLEKACISEILVLLCQNCGKQASANSSITQKFSILEDVNTYIDAHMLDKITIDDLAGHVFLSRFRFVHVFKEITGMTAMQFVTRRRLMKARDCIMSGVSFSEAYRQCGFTEYSSFYRAFISEYGVSPREYYSFLHRQRT